MHLSYSGQLNITGNEQPLIIGLSRDINCTWSGEANVTMMEWFGVGLEAVAVETATGSRTILLTLVPDSDGLDGAMFICRATFSEGIEIEKSITLTVQGINIFALLSSQSCYKSESIARL